MLNLKINWTFFEHGVVYQFANSLLIVCVNQVFSKYTLKTKKHQSYLHIYWNHYVLQFIART